MGKVVNQVKLTIPSHLSIILGEKIEKYAKMAVLTQSKSFFGQIAIVGHFQPHWCETIEKVGKLQKIADVPPPSANENF